jgi:class 3 adenylate cyclase
MDKDKIQELLERKALADQELQRMRAQVTIMFTDIKGSTAYFEKKGDVEGMAMITRHNAILFPIIKQYDGRIVKTIGDAIMASFRDQENSIKAAVEMQRALESDRKGRPEGEKIHIRIGIHTGLGLERDDDVFGDVVNAASRTQQQCAPDQILITDVLVEAAKAAGFPCAKLGRAEMRGKDEPIDLYAVAWSESAAEQLIEEVQSQFEGKLKEARRQYEQLEEDFENARETWRGERRNLTAEIEELEESVELAREGARQEVSDALQSELRFQLEEALNARRQAEEELADAREKWTVERETLRTQINGMQATVIEAMERSNNPTRMAMAIREQVEARVAEAKQDWLLQWEGERKRLTTEIERLKRGSSYLDERKEAARRAVLEKMGKLPRGSSSTGVKGADYWEKQYSDAKITWETEREQLNLKLHKLEREVQNSKDNVRSEIFQELRGQYEPKLIEANQARARLQQEIDMLRAELNDERRRLSSRIRQLEQALPEAQAAVRKQVAAELQAQFDLKVDEANRVRSRLERKHQDTADEWEAESRRTRKQLAELQEQLREAKEAAFRAQRASGRTTD